MIDKKTIEEVKERLIKTYNPLAIYVFGSYAWGCPDEESDLDLLIVVENIAMSRHHALVEGHRALIGMGLSKDLILLTKEEFEKDSEDITTLHYKIKRRGKQIYAKA